MAEGNEEKKQNKLLIEFIFRPQSKFTLRKARHPIQDKPFYFGLKITNSDTKIFPGAVIKNFGINSLEQKKLEHSFEKNEFIVRSLSPGETVEVWWPDAMSTCLEGLTWVYCDIVPNTLDEEVITYQKDRSTGVIDKYKDFNKWGDAIYIERKFELEQSRTNSLVFILTVLTFLEGLFGLKTLANFLITQVQNLFFLSAGFLGRLIIK